MESACSNNLKVDLSLYQNRLSLKNKIGRAVWNVIYLMAFRPFSLTLFNPWRLFVLRCFGARLHPKAHIYSTVRIWAPWNLEMDAYSCLAPEVDCYNTALVKIGVHSIISQKSYLCTSSHNIADAAFPLIMAPIVIKDQVWVAANTFVGMGVTIGQGAVIGACSCVFSNVDPWLVVGGNPARVIKKRVILED